MNFYYLKSFRPGSQNFFASPRRMSSHERPPASCDITDADSGSLHTSQNETVVPDVERQEENNPASVDRAHLQPPYTNIVSNSPIKSICFVCLNRGKNGHYAIRVPFLIDVTRPIESANLFRRLKHLPREHIEVQIRLQRENIEANTHIPIVPLTTIEPDRYSNSIIRYLYSLFWMHWNRFAFYQRTGLWDKVTEGNTAIFRRINAACFYYQGWWKRWLPLYGVKSVQAVKVRK